MSVYCFSGHESFACKTLWLKKGYDFAIRGGDFNAADAVIKLGVGKNMVASIKYWTRVCGLMDNEWWMGRYLFDEIIGRDKYLEDIATLWLIHFYLCFRNEATLYNYFYCFFQKEREVFEKEHIVNGINYYLSENGKSDIISGNTINKDIDVLLRNYVLPRKPQSNEDFSSLFIDLDLLRMKENGTEYYFNHDGKRAVPDEVFMHALMLLHEQMGDESISCDDIHNKIATIFCMTKIETIEMLKRLSERYRKHMAYSEEAGIRQVQFVGQMTLDTPLNNYYRGNI